MIDFTSSKLFGLVLSIVAFYLALRINRRFKTPVLNPLVLAIIFVILFLKVFRVPFNKYNLGGDLISTFLTPVIALLAYSIHKQAGLLKKHFIPILIGCLAGVITSLTSVFLLCRLFKLDDALTNSMLPKSVTTAFAIEISGKLGGVPSITVAAVLITGIMGAVICPFLIKILKVQNKVAAGIAIGSCSHAIGTTKAIELGEVEGAMSGISIGISGIITVLIMLFL